MKGTSASIPAIDIRPDHWQIVRHILRLRVPQYAVWAFGSRAKWTAKPHSDLDLAVITDQPLPLSVSAALSDDFSESNLPWKVDVVDWTATSESFRKVIERDKVVLQEPAPASDAATEWPIVRIEDIAEKIAMGPFGSNIKVETFVESGVPVISGSHLRGIKLEDSNYNFITEEHADRLKNSNVFRGDVVFTHAGNIGQVAYIPPGSQYERYVLSQRQFYLRCNLSRADPAFMSYFFHGDEGQHKLLANASQTGVPSIARPSSYLKTIELRLPPIEEQRAIAETLGALDDRIDNLRQANATLEAIAAALFKSWFVDFERWGCFMRTGWREVPFGELLSNSIGGDWGSEARDDNNVERVAIIRGTDIPDLRSQANIRVPVRYTTAKKLISRRLEAGDLIVEVSGGSKGQSTGRSIYLTDELLGQFDCPVVPASFCRKFTPINKKIGLLLAQHMSYIYDTGKTWEYQNQSTGIANFQTAHFLKTERVVVPSDEILDSFFDAISPTVQKRHSTQISTLATLRDTLLPRLISGKLRVKDAGRLAEDA